MVLPERRLLEVLDDPMTMDSEEGESQLGNPTVMYVGQTQKERLLEIGVEYKEKKHTSTMEGKRMRITRLNI